VTHGPSHAVPGHHLDRSPTPAVVANPPLVAATLPSTRSGGERWSAEETRRVWAQALEEMDPITATLARAVDHVEPTERGMLRMVFRAESQLAMRRCENPDHRGEIVSVLSRIVGRPISIELVTLSPKVDASPDTPRTSGRSRMQRMREIESNELVRGCIELFNAEIVRVDVPRD